LQFAPWPYIAFELPERTRIVEATCAAATSKCAADGTAHHTHWPTAEESRDRTANEPPTDRVAARCAV